MQIPEAKGLQRGPIRSSIFGDYEPIVIENPGKYTMRVTPIGGRRVKVVTSYIEGRGIDKREIKAIFEKATRGVDALNKYVNEQFPWCFDMLITLDNDAALKTMCNIIIGSEQVFNARKTYEQKLEEIAKE